MTSEATKNELESLQTKDKTQWIFLIIYFFQFFNNIYCKNECSSNLLGVFLISGFGSKHSNKKLIKSYNCVDSSYSLYSLYILIKSFQNGFDLNEKNFCGEQKLFYKNRLLSLGAAF